MKTVAAENKEIRTVTPVVPIAQLDPQCTSNTLVNTTVYRLGWLLVVDAVLFALLFAVLLLPFTIQTIPSGCNSIADPPLPNKLYYNLWQGVGTTPECKQTDTDYCIKWSNNKAWSYMDSITGSNMAYGRNSIVGSKSLLTIAVIIAVVTLLYHATVLWTITYTGTMSSNMMVYSGASGHLFFIWIFAIIASNLFLNTDQLRMPYWQSVWLSGYTIPDILHQTSPSGQKSAVTACNPSLVESNGAILLGTATTVAFIASIVLCCIACAQMVHPRHARLYRYTSTTSPRRIIVS